VALAFRVRPWRALNLVRALAQAKKWVRLQEELLNQETRLPGTAPPALSRLQRQATVIKRVLKEELAQHRQLASRKPPALLRAYSLVTKWAEGRSR
jgi:hypothetical protein